MTTPPAVLVVTATARETDEITAAAVSLLGEDAVVSYPAWETLPHERLSPRSDTVGRRLAVLRRLVHPGEDGTTATPIRVVVAPVRSVLQPQVKGLADLEPVSLQAGDEVDLEDVVRRLAAAAYHRVDMVERRGEFAVRGGIVDVFPPTDEHPVRVEFWGDEVEEIRSFAVADQRSLDVTRSLWAPPCRELLLTDDVRSRARELASDHPELREMLDKLAEGPCRGGHGVPRAGPGRRHGAARRPAADGVDGAGVRPRAGAGAGSRPGRDQPGVPPGLLGRGRRRGSGTDRPGRSGIPRASVTSAPTRSTADVAWWSISPFGLDAEAAALAQTPVRTETGELVELDVDVSGTVETRALDVRARPRLPG